MWTPAEFFRRTMLTHEGALSRDPKDDGNWFDASRYQTGLRQKAGIGQLIGSKYGVTPAALAQHLGVSAVTKQMMTELTPEVAADIALHAYYFKPKLDILPWNRAIMSVFDMGYNAGTKSAIELLQKEVGAPADGSCGPTTKKYVETYLAKFGEEKLAQGYCQRRVAYYKSLHNPRYERGWIARAESFLPGSLWWRDAA